MKFPWSSPRSIPRRSTPTRGSSPTRIAPRCRRWSRSAPIHRAVGLERLILSSYQSVSGTGRRAIEELRTQTEDMLGGRAPKAEVYPHQIAFNVLPQVETFEDGDDYTTEERKVMAETRKILELGPEVGISATCVRVPVIGAHSESINVQTREDLSPEECRELLAASPGIVVIDDPAAGRYPMAIDATGRDEVLVGRIRRDPGQERCLNLWVVGDNLRKGAATNAVQVAELLAERGLLGTVGRASPGSRMESASATRCWSSAACWRSPRRCRG